MNLEQWKALQPKVVELQRLALHFFEIGEADVSRLVLAASLKAAKIKPDRGSEVVIVDDGADGFKVEPAKPAKGRGA